MKNKLKCKVFLCRWRGFNHRYKPLDSLQIERERHDKVYSVMRKYIFCILCYYGALYKKKVYSLLLPFQERTLEEHKKLVDRVMKRDKKRRKMVEAAGIDYECPQIVSFFVFLLLISCFDRP